MQFIVLGLVLGSIYAVLALGQVVVFRSSGVVNFAHCGVALVSAFAYLDMRSHGLGAAVAVPMTLVIGTVLGLLIYLVAIHPLRRASTLTRAIATLAVLVILQSVLDIRYGSNPQIPPPFLPQGRVELGPFTTSIANLTIVIACFALVAGLSLAYKRTDFGRITSAVAENSLAATLLGHSVNVNAAINWSVGGLLAAAAGVLVGPVYSITPSLSTALLIPTLAVALCGQFRSFPLLLAGGVFIGLAQGQLTRFADSALLAPLPGLSDALPFLVIMVVLIVRGDSLPGRDFAAAILPRVGSGVMSRWWLAGWVAVALLLIVTADVVWVAALTTGAIAAMLLLSLVVLTGYAGQLSLAQVSIGGVGVLAASLLVGHLGWPMPLAALAGVLATLPVALLVGLPSLRTRGVTLAVVTLGLATTLNVMLFNRSDVNNSGAGIEVGTANLAGWTLDETLDPRGYAVFAVALLALVAMAVSNLRRSAVGRLLIAVRSNERASAALGISVTKVKLYAFVVSGAIAAVAGILSAWRLPTVVMSGNYDPFRSVTAVIQSTLGGVGYISGAVFGGVAVPPGSIGGTVVDEIGLGQWLGLIAGVLLLVNILLNPDGVVPTTLAAVGSALKRIGPLGRIGQTRRSKRAERRQAQLHRRFGEGGAGAPRSSGDTVLSVHELAVTFGATRALDGVDFEVRGGEVLGIIGSNGSGKTTLVDAITGYVPSRGVVTLNDRSLSVLPAHRRSTIGVSRSFQSLELFDDLSVADNLLTAARQGGWWQWLSCLVWPGRKPVPPAVVAAVQEFGLHDLLDKAPSEIPYGKRKLLAIARALASGPRVLFLDEPAAGLGEVDRAEMRRLVRRLAQEWRMAVIIIEHDVELVMDVSDRVLALSQGKVITQGVAAEVRAHPEVISAYLGATEEQPRRGAEHSEAGSQSGPPVLSVRGLSAGYGGVDAIHDITLDVRAGEVVALLGANGAGKTTLLHAISGVISPSGGGVELFGGAPQRSVHNRIRAGVALMPDEHAVFRELTVRDNLLLGRGDPDEALALFPELETRIGVRAGLLSGGEQQMLSLARIIAGRPQLILADELSLGLAPLVVRRLWEALTAAAQQGVAVLVVEQHVKVALDWSQRAYVMRRGSIEIADSSVELLDRIHEVQAIYL
ncbi:ATP-binding cassette domain-containing protein (plasmid) [Rhodococcus sp. USK10]|uniref:ATP-binding cassette domain-containing protein n=1 Tax=Rhodococcus sp. USK10 TaxID=2789739 RepID=UPI001C5D4AAD|nr:ATP-binding cassette domain-containing protein [Rhodococcus sp. USK10]QYB00186.1 ATP-binding cassette domain-containing protein [Rhodococcus sp. USK10]